MKPYKLPKQSYPRNQTKQQLPKLNTKDHQLWILPPTKVVSDTFHKLTKPNQTKRQLICQLEVNGKTEIHQR